jgi:hypothetical protein
MASTFGVLGLVFVIAAIGVGNRVRSDSKRVVTAGLLIGVGAVFGVASIVLAFV